MFDFAEIVEPLAGSPRPCTCARLNWLHFTDIGSGKNPRIYREAIKILDKKDARERGEGGVRVGEADETSADCDLRAEEEAHGAV